MKPVNKIISPEECPLLFHSVHDDDITKIKNTYDIGEKTSLVIYNVISNTRRSYQRISLNQKNNCSISIFKNLLVRKDANKFTPISSLRIMNVFLTEAKGVIYGSRMST